MKDIKRYFANGAGLDVLSGAAESSRLERGPAAVAARGGGRKRGRVKIRITRTSSRERVCDIVESKNDLIDKTPSPFTRPSDDERVARDGTPKCSRGGAERDLEKDSKFGDETMAVNEDKSGEIKTILRDVLDKNRADKNDSSKYIVDLDSSSDNARNVDSTSVSNVTFHDDSGSQREESNAFQVLMNRTKPIQYKSLPQQTVEDTECKEIADDAKEIRSKRKETLIALADKKGYSKRKFIETEEGERIEKNIESRMRFFKGSSCNERDDTAGAAMKNHRQSSGNLLNYFSKSSLELTNDKDEKCVSTFIVKADVHRTDAADVAPVLKPISNKIYSNKRCSQSDLDLSSLDDIQVIASENLVLPRAVEQHRRQQEKPRWSLRIKLHASENNDSYNDSSDDERLFSPRSKSKFNADSNKSRKPVNSCVEEKDNGARSKKHNRRVKTRMRSDKEQSGTDKRRKGSDAETNTAENVVVDRDNNENSDEARPKTEEELNGSACESIVTINDDSECEIVVENMLKRRPNEKLAPLFTKRRKTDPIVAAARRLFLQSEIIDRESKTTDRKTNSNGNNGTSTLPFPAISHVTQLEENPDREIRPEIKLPTRVDRRYSPLINISNYKCIVNYAETPKATVTVNERVTENFDQVLSEIEERCPDVRRMWKTVSTVKGESEKKPTSRLRGRKAKSLERKAAVATSSLTESVDGIGASRRTHDCVWTCKYKPMCAQDVVGNEEAARRLKDWLSGWRASLTRENDSSGDEFYSSDCSRTSYNNENNQVAVLMGPHGSGKSASVYAIAEELSYSVLEVNASSRRTGKRILKELEEATKSHRIKKNRHKSPFERARASESETPRISQNSLILLEDIDLIFEEDEGFVSAAYQLASNTKRPIVMTCRDTCPHLSRMTPQQNKIYFQRVSGSGVSALLELISLAETGHRLPNNCLMKLLQAGDLRKALLQLQYLLLSGPPVLTEQSTFVRPSLWQDMQRYLYKPAIKLHKRQTVKKETNNVEKFDKRANDITASILDDLADNLDGLSLVSSLIDVEDTTLNVSEANAQPNLSLAENLSLYSASRYLNADMANFVNDRILCKKPVGDEHMQNQSHVILRKQLNQGVDLALSHVTFACLDRRVMALDYLPTARTICRAEESRSCANYKRGNRFFHYLHGLKVPTASMKPNILAAACRTLQERANKTAPTSSVVSVTVSE